MACSRAQLTIGNTSFHKLFSVSRDPYNITRGSGLRMLADLGEGWRLLTVPSAFEMGLGDCRWIYRLGERTITVSAFVSADEPALQWRVSVEGAACRFLVFGHLVLGEREFEGAGRMEIDAAEKSFAFRPDPASLWGQRYPNAVYRWVSIYPRARSKRSAPTNFFTKTASVAAAVTRRSAPARQTGSSSPWSAR